MDTTSVELHGQPSRGGDGLDSLTLDAVTEATQGTGEMSQRSYTLPTLQEDPSSVPSAHMEAYNCL